jgi:HMG box factor, other
MSTLQKSLPSLPVPWEGQGIVQTPSADDTSQITYTRHLWQRTMPEYNDGELGVLNKSQSQYALSSHNNSAAASRRTSSNVSTRSQCRRSASLSRASKTPLTPEESPPSSVSKKRAADAIDVEDQESKSATTTLTHSRGSSGDSALHVCICQPDPKIPRPRNGTHVCSVSW